MAHEILNERCADLEVIKSLEKHIIKLKGKHYMSRIVLFKDNDGLIKRAHSFEPTTREELTNYISELEATVKEAYTALAEFDNLLADSTAAPAVAIADEVQPVAPANEPQAVTITPEAPVATEAPILPVQPEVTDLTSIPATDQTPVAPIEVLVPVVEQAPLAPAPEVIQ